LQVVDDDEGNLPGHLRHLSHLLPDRGDVGLGAVGPMEEQPVGIGRHLGHRLRPGRTVREPLGQGSSASVERLQRLADPP
jgi:hypothetical protein